MKTTWKPLSEEAKASWKIWNLFFFFFNMPDISFENVSTVKKAYLKGEKKMKLHEFLKIVQRIIWQITAVLKSRAADVD